MDALVAPVHNILFDLEFYLEKQVILSYQKHKRVLHNFM